jgi:hypothetical protein
MSELTKRPCKQLERRIMQDKSMKFPRFYHCWRLTWHIQTLVMKRRLKRLAIAFMHFQIQSPMKQESTKAENLINSKTLINLCNSDDDCSVEVVAGKDDSTNCKTDKMMGTSSFEKNDHANKEDDSENVGSGDDDSKD